MPSPELAASPDRCQRTGRATEQTRWHMQQNVHCTCHYLSLQHLQACVCELVEGQRGLDEIDTVDHVGRHVHRVEAAGRHGAHLQQGIDHARQNLHSKHTEGTRSMITKHRCTGHLLRTCLRLWVKGKSCQQLRNTVLRNTFNPVTSACEWLDTNCLGVNAPSKPLHFLCLCRATTPILTKFKMLLSFLFLLVKNFTLRSTTLSWKATSDSESRMMSYYGLLPRKCSGNLQNASVMLTWVPLGIGTGFQSWKKCLLSIPFHTQVPSS